MNPKAIISLKNLSSNLEYLKSKLEYIDNLMPVIKANAYGHGAIKVGQYLSQLDIKSLCVATESEVRELLDSKIKKSILFLGKIHKNNINLFVNNNVRCTINDIKDIDILDEILGEKQHVICHLKIDTGLNRMGCEFNLYKEVINKLLKCNSIKLESIYSHLACSDNSEDSLNDLQINKFFEVISYIKQNNENHIVSFHLLNSSGVYNYGKYSQDYCRVGLSMYGVSPLGSPDIKLKPVMKFIAPIILIKEVKKGESIGYGATYIASNNITVAIVRCGYADGIPVSFSNKGEVEYNGKFYPILGRVSMDLICIEVDEDMKQFDYVTIWGGEYDRMKLETISAKFNILPYVLMTGISNRVERVYEN